MREVYVLRLLHPKPIFIEHNSRRKAGRKARRKLKIVQIKEDREYLGEKAPVLGKKVSGPGEKLAEKLEC